MKGLTFELKVTKSNHGCGMLKITIGLMALSENLGRDDWIEEPYCVPSFLLYATLQLGTSSLFS